VYDFVVQKPYEGSTKNLDLEALFAKTKIIGINEEKLDDQKVYRVKVQESSDSKKVDKLMDYLKYRGCQVNMIQRYVAQQPPVPKPERDLSRCMEEQESQHGPNDYQDLQSNSDVPSRPQTAAH
jgi:hypothetical protein